MVTQLRALGQLEVVEGTLMPPVPADIAQPTADETKELNAWTLRNARAYAEIALRLEDEFSESISSITNPRDAWRMLETTYGAQQTGIQGVITAELTLAHWDGQTPINAHRDHMKSLRTRLSAAGVTISDMQFYQYFTNSFPAEYDMVPGIFNPALTGHLVDYLCEQIRGIELRRELRTAHPGGTGEDPLALAAKQKGPRAAGKSTTTKGEKTESPGSKPKRVMATCWGCGKKGHYQRNCHSTKKEKGENTSGGSALGPSRSAGGGPSQRNRHQRNPPEAQFSASQTHVSLHTLLQKIFSGITSIVALLAIT